MHEFFDNPHFRSEPEPNRDRDFFGWELSILDELQQLYEEGDECGKSATFPDGKTATNPNCDNPSPALVPQGLPAPSQEPLCSVSHIPPLLPLHTRLKQRTPKTTKPTPWKLATQRQKFAHAATVAERSNGIAFTLNLAPRIQRSVYTADDPVRHFSHYLNRELKKAGLSGTPYAFAFELTELQAGGSQKLHVHGMLLADEEQAKPLKAALMAAGGKIKGRAASRQVKLRSLTDAGGWAAYLAKDAELTAALLDRDTFINVDLLRLTREDWKERR